MQNLVGQTFELQEALLRLGLALAIGVLVGVERHWRERDAKPGTRTAGLRTFGLSGLLGGATALLAGSPGLGGPPAGAFVLGTSFIAYAASLIVFKLREAIEDETMSVTSVVAGMLVFVLGAMAVIGDRAVVAATGVTMTAVLASREMLHGLLRRLSWLELRSAITILVMSFVVLPLVPGTPVGPYGGVDFAEIWTLAILIATVSYVGYVAAKLLGARKGILLAGALGGLASSTAVTLSFARRAAAAEAPTFALIAGALAASAVAILRIGTLAIALRPGLLPALAPPLAAAAFVFVLLAVGIGARTDTVGKPDLGRLDNPFDLPVVLRMTAFIAFAAFLVRAGSAHFGSEGIVPLAALAGLADADAVVLSVARLPGENAPITAIARAVGAAIGADVTAKAGFALAFGDRRYGLVYAGSAGAALLAGAAAFWFVPAPGSS